MTKPGPMSDPAAQDRMRQVEKRRAMQHEEDLRALMASDWGRRIAWDLIQEKGGLQTGSFDGAIKDGTCADRHMAFREGRRDLAIDLHNEIQRVAPTALALMYQEQIREADRLMVEREQQQRKEREQDD